MKVGKMDQYNKQSMSIYMEMEVGRQEEEQNIYIASIPKNVQRIKKGNALVKHSSYLRGAILLKFKE